MQDSSINRLAADGSQYAPSIPYNPDCNPEEKAEALYSAMSGVGTDEDALIEILGSCNGYQRQEISKKYMATYGKSLEDDLSSELSGNFKKVVKMSLNSPAKNAATILYKAMKGIGCDEKKMINILCTMTNREIMETKQAYAEVLSEEGERGDINSLEKRVKSELSGLLERICLGLLQANRNEPDEQALGEAMAGNVEGIINREKAAEQAAKLYKAGEKRLGTDEGTFLAILLSQSCWQLAAINMEYQNVSKNTLEKAIEKEFGGDAEKALLAILRSAIDRPRYYATRFHKAMAGLGTNDDDLIYLVVTRSEIDLTTIKAAYAAEYSRSLTEDIASETSGDYRKFLLALCGGED